MSRRSTRALTLGEQAALARSATDIELPDHPQERAEAIDRLARMPVTRKHDNDR